MPAPLKLLLLAHMLTFHWPKQVTGPPYNVAGEEILSLQSSGSHMVKSKDLLFCNCGGNVELVHHIIISFFTSSQRGLLSKQI